MENHYQQRPVDMPERRHPDVSQLGPRWGCQYRTRAGLSYTGCGSCSGTIHAMTATVAVAAAASTVIRWRLISGRHILGGVLGRNVLSACLARTRSSPLSCQNLHMSRGKAVTTCSNMQLGC